MEDHPLSDKQVREKLIARGASALTDTELLSILLHGSGPGGPATELAGRLLDRFEGSLARMVWQNCARPRVWASPEPPYCPPRWNWAAG